MKSYNLETKLTFGKFKGKSIKELIDLEPSYINWCIVNLDHFYISEHDIEEMEKYSSKFSISEEAKQKLKEKYEMYSDVEEDVDYVYDDYDDYDDYDYDNTYEEYNGTWAQDVEGLSDDFIDDALDGEPDAYWNID